MRKLIEYCKNNKRFILKVIVIVLLTSMSITLLLFDRSYSVMHNNISSFRFDTTVWLDNQEFTGDKFRIGRCFDKSGNDSYYGLQVLAGDKEYLEMVFDSNFSLYGYTWIYSSASDVKTNLFLRSLLHEDYVTIFSSCFYSDGDTASLMNLKNTLRRGLVSLLYNYSDTSNVFYRPLLFELMDRADVVGKTFPNDIEPDIATLLKDYKKVAIVWISNPALCYSCTFKKLKSYIGGKVPVVVFARTKDPVFDYLKDDKFIFKVDSSSSKGDYLLYENGMIVIDSDKKILFYRPFTEMNMFDFLDAVKTYFQK